MAEIQQDFIGVDLKERGEKWEILQARATPEDKRDIFLHCKANIHLSYSVVTRLIWKRILSNYRSMPQQYGDPISEINQAVDEVMEYLPAIRQQRRYTPRKY